jgi:hypothetical protein
MRKITLEFTWKQWAVIHQALRTRINVINEVKLFMPRRRWDEPEGSAPDRNDTTYRHMEDERDQCRDLEDVVRKAIERMFREEKKKSKGEAKAKIYEVKEPPR